MTPQPKIAIATPVRDGQITIQTHATILQFAKYQQFPIFALPPWGDDIVRVRSRIAAEFLKTDCTHLFMVDADVSFHHDLPIKLLEADKPIIFAPYAKKKLNVRAVREGRVQDMYDWPFIRLDVEKPDDKDCMKVAAGPAGCVLLQREVIETMTEHYRDSLTFLDRYEDMSGEPIEQDVVALWMLILKNKQLMPEDFSFFTRARQIGLDVWMFCHAVDHSGQFTFKGDFFGLADGQ